MKKLPVLLFFTLVLFAGTQAMACVGKVLNIGVSSSPGDQLLAEMVSVLVSERTGTTVKVVTFRTHGEIYSALKQGQVGLMIENTGDAMELLKRPRETSGKAALDLVKKEYRKIFNLIWLEPFGSQPGSGGSDIYAPVIAADVLGNLPALPKLVNKLAGVVNDGSYQKLLKAVKSDEKIKKVARDFLKTRKLI
jgi:glycine betaine/choline ABC-type transport system substrate-binding protein